MARGYKHSVLSYATAGATSLFTTVGDLARWSHFIDDGIAAGTTMSSTMLTHGVLNDGEVLPYAAGLTVGDYRGLRVVEHSGGDAGFRSQFSCFPDQHAAVVVLGNLSTLQPSGLVRRVADVHLAKSFTKDLPPAAPLTTQLSRSARNNLEAWPVCICSRQADHTPHRIARWHIGARGRTRLPIACAGP